MKENNGGITLISLVITIIILLILSGIVILSLEENGLFEKLKLANNKTENTQILENEILTEYENQIDKFYENNNDLFEIDEHIKVDKKIYISSKEGSDETGTGVKDNPYSTLDKISEKGIIENNYSYAIILMDGTYKLTKKIFELDCNKSINIIGNKEKTILEEENGLYANIGGGSILYNVNMYRLIWNGKKANTNAVSLKTSLNLYNVAFKMDFVGASYSYFSPSDKETTIFNFYNCTLGTNVSSFLRTTHGTMQLTNCYGGFTSGYGTNNSNWDYKTNYITSEPSVDADTYKITDNESIWKNKGTGKNPDGTQANLGLYGGEYSWEK